MITRTRSVRARKWLDFTARLDFVVTIYKATESFPKEEKFGLTSQVRRAAVSVPANSAEGAARRPPKEFVHFISNAQGSASELETELLIAHRLGYLQEGAYLEMRDTLDKIGRVLIGLTRHLEKAANRKP